MVIECYECTYWFPVDVKEEKGICKRRSPFPMKNLSQGSNPFLGFFNYGVIWPYTRNIDGCGEGESGREPQTEKEILANVPETKREEMNFDNLVKRAKENV